MEAMRSTWTDSRLDDLNDRVKGMDGKIDRLDGRIDSMSDRIDKLQHAIIVVGGGLFAAFVVFLAAILGLIVTLIVLHS